MNENKLKNEMHTIFDELKKSNNEKTDKTNIAKAVNLGMKYQEEKIKEGINIVFEELHNKK